MVLPLLLLLASTSLTLLPSAVASAEDPRPPASWTIDLAPGGWTEHYEGDTYSWQSEFNISFTLSPDDSNQTTGDYAYYLFASRNDGSAAGGGTNCDAPFRLQVDASTCAGFLGTLGNATGGNPASPIPDRTRWVYGKVFSYASTRFDEWNLTLYTAAYNLTNGRLGGASCGLPVKFQDGRQIPTWSYDSNDAIITLGHVQCGSVVRPAAGIAAIVTSQYGASSPSVTNVTWSNSTSDVGNFEYWTFFRGTTARPDLTTYVGLRETAQSYRLLNLFGGVGTNDPIYIEILTRDNLTHQRSEFSCLLKIQSGLIYDSDACGALGEPNAGPTIGTPSFPGMNLTGIAVSMGLTPEYLGWIVGGITILGVMIGGFVVAGKVGGLVGAILGLAFAATLSLFGYWLLIVVFFAAVAIIVVRMQGGTSE